MIEKITTTILSILKSKKFFYFVIAVLFIQALWMALTASYPMAFDESFHMGIIQIYSHQWGPILSKTPVDSAQYGELTHDPSYLYHYLMSFPYRIIHPLVNSYAGEIIVMRLLNTGLFIGGLFAFRKLLVRIGASRALTHFSLFMLVLLPVTPFLAAHINYDNMFFWLVPINIWFALNCAETITKSKKVFAKDFILLITIGFLTCLVKYVFLPIFLAIFLYLFFLWIRSGKKKAILKNLVPSFAALSRRVQIGLSLLFIISTGLFIQRYAVNVIEYGNVQPECSKVESVQSCLRYGPWVRNYYLAISAEAPDSVPNPTKALFLPNWFGGMIYRLYFAINYDFDEYSAMPLPIGLAYVVGIVGTIALFVFWKAVLRINQHILLLIAVILFYSLSLLYINFTDYLHYHTMVAINGRYFIPLLPFICIIIGLAFRHVLSVVFKQNSTKAKVLLCVIASLCAANGGGVLTYLIHSDAVWYWQYDPLTGFNLFMKKIATALTIGAPK